jgi:hypothetical protein
MAGTKWGPTQASNYLRGASDAEGALNRWSSKGSGTSGVSFLQSLLGEQSFSSQLSNLSLDSSKLNSSSMQQLTDAASTGTFTLNFEAKNLDKAAADIQKITSGLTNAATGVTQLNAATGGLIPGSSQGSGGTPTVAGMAPAFGGAQHAASLGGGTPSGGGSGGIGTPMGIGGGGNLPTPYAGGTPGLPGGGNAAGVNQMFPNSGQGGQHSRNMSGGVGGYTPGQMSGGGFQGTIPGAGFTMSGGSPGGGHQTAIGGGSTGPGGGGPNFAFGGGPGGPGGGGGGRGPVGMSPPGSGGGGGNYQGMRNFLGRNSASGSSSGGRGSGSGWWNRNGGPIRTGAMLGLYQGGKETVSALAGETSYKQDASITNAGLAQAQTSPAQMQAYHSMIHQAAVRNPFASTEQVNRAAFRTGSSGGISPGDPSYSKMLDTSLVLGQMMGSGASEKVMESLSAGSQSMMYNKNIYGNMSQQDILTSQGEGVAGVLSQAPGEGGDVATYLGAMANMERSMGITRSENVAFFGAFMASQIPAGTSGATFKHLMLDISKHAAKAAAFRQVTKDFQLKYPKESAQQAQERAAAWVNKRGFQEGSYIKSPLRGKRGQADTQRLKNEQIMRNNAVGAAFKRDFAAGDINTKAKMLGPEGPLADLKTMLDLGVSAGKLGVPIASQQVLEVLQGNPALVQHMIDLQKAETNPMHGKVNEIRAQQSQYQGASWGTTKNTVETIVSNMAKNETIKGVLKNFNEVWDMRNRKESMVENRLLNEKAGKGLTLDPSVRASATEGLTPSAAKAITSGAEWEAANQSANPIFSAIYNAASWSQTLTSSLNPFRMADQLALGVSPDPYAKVSKEAVLGPRERAAARVAGTTHTERQNQLLAGSNVNATTDSHAVEEQKERDAYQKAAEDKLRLTGDVKGYQKDIKAGGRGLTPNKELMSRASTYHKTLNKYTKSLTPEGRASFGAEMRGMGAVHNQLKAEKGEGLDFTKISPDQFPYATKAGAEVQKAYEKAGLDIGKQWPSNVSTSALIDPTASLADARGQSKQASIAAPFAPNADDVHKKSESMKNPSPSLPPLNINVDASGSRDLMKTADPIIKTDWGEKKTGNNSESSKSASWPASGR